PAEEQAARVVPVIAELLAALPDRRRVDQRQHFREVARYQRIKQRLIGILQPAQENIAIEVAVESAQRLEPPRELRVEGSDMRRQEAVQCKGSALVLGEGGPLVQ